MGANNFIGLVELFFECLYIMKFFFRNRNIDDAVFVPTRDVKTYGRSQVVRVLAYLVLAVFAAVGFPDRDTFQLDYGVEDFAAFERNQLGGES